MREIPLKTAPHLSARVASQLGKRHPFPKSSTRTNIIKEPFFARLYHTIFRFSLRAVRKAPGPACGSIGGQPGSQNRHERRGGAPRFQADQSRRGSRTPLPPAWERRGRQSVWLPSMHVQELDPLTEPHRGMSTPTPFHER